MGDFLKHECGIAVLRLKKPLAYYHDKYGVSGNLSNKHHHTLDETNRDKVKLSWNIGLGNVFTRKSLGGRLGKKKLVQYLLQTRYVTPRFTSPTSKRAYDIHYKGAHHKKLKHDQRLKTIEWLENRDDLHTPDIGQEIPYLDYVRQIRQSKAVMSPFGYGEICTRDFEAFAAGATLIKPDMEHLNTYPNWYIKDKTYLSVDWDFSNFDDLLDEIHRDPARCQTIAENAQALVKRYRTDPVGKQEFVEHVLRTIGLL